MCHRRLSGFGNRGYGAASSGKHTATVNKRESKVLVDMSTPVVFLPGLAAWGESVRPALAVASIVSSGPNTIHLTYDVGERCRYPALAPQ
jgi:hypothetical protein